LRPELVIKPGDGGPVSCLCGRTASSDSAPDVQPEEGGASAFEKAKKSEKGWKGIGAVSATFPSCVQTIGWMGHRLEAEGGCEEFAVEVEFRG
jgi:hypothetical protein